MSAKQASAKLAGTVSLGGEVSVNRIGFGAMRLTGAGIWGPPLDRAEAIAVLRRLVRSYPGSGPANLARAKLEELQ